MLYLILTLILGMGDDEPWVLLLLQLTKGGVVELGFSDESWGMVGAQAVLGILQYYMIVK